MTFDCEICGEPTEGKGDWEEVVRINTNDRGETFNASVIIACGDCIAEFQTNRDGQTGMRFLQAPLDTEEG